MIYLTAVTCVWVCSLGKRRRRVFRVFKRTLPKIYSCPRCGVVSVRVSIKESTALVACGSCSLKQEYPMIGKKESIDIYNEFIDRFMSESV